jgi:hypothetical protein
MNRLITGMVAAGDYPVPTIDWVDRQFMGQLP